MYAPTKTDNYPTQTSIDQAKVEQILAHHNPNYISPTLPNPHSPTSPTSPQTPQTPHSRPQRNEAKLNKQSHINFLARLLIQGFPDRYTSQDASQPWLIFWIVQGLSLLGVGLDAGNKQKIINTLLACQSPLGGFGGGPGQAPHLLTTYAAVCTLAIVGRPGPQGGWDQIDRKKLYAFFLSLKQPDGSTLVSPHSEVDVRGTYCLLVTSTLLDILTPPLSASTPSFIASCQTYEGGFASASQPYYSPYFKVRNESTLMSDPRPPLGEAHGGYTFCAVASWVMLAPLRPPSNPSSPPNPASNPQTSPSPRPEYPTSQFTPSQEEGPKINTRSLVRWLTSLQGSPLELGAFRGRTNKLVDGCYSWWVGGCFGVLEGLGIDGANFSHYSHSKAHASGGQGGQGEGEGKSEEDEWADDDDALFNKRALQEYILYAAQAPTGGLRDKPPKHADSYHTLYNLSGLSNAQHRVHPSAEVTELLEKNWVDTPPPSPASAPTSTPPSPPSKTEETEETFERPDIYLSKLPSESYEAWNARRKRIWMAASAWSEDESEGSVAYVGGSDNRVNASHPLFNLTITHSRGMLNHFYGQSFVVPS
ncbi:terpenoid cyclases/Protein prenyltransferase [Sistotremastrum niveocremeum HHB9708]|uniref:Protein farnesyltransferase subunit beta n=1 Tax=Sistotremastrum niveocremeum HHB9708 TaxID=1314777 RepID=A0A164WL61_9AGAM|nr:terpenoid cyclases/Protein prenyltransferase [Sistotremastrum niveocremeum HHB9708]